MKTLLDKMAQGKKNKGMDFPIRIGKFQLPANKS